MFDYCGDINASLDDFRGVLSKVIHETYPTAKFTVRVRQTKAMRSPKISISIMDGPLCADLVEAIPLLVGVSRAAYWAYCGKVLPCVDSWIRTHPKSTFPKYSQAVWNQMQQEDLTLSSLNPDWLRPPRSRPCSLFTHRHRLSGYVKNIHPAQPSPTMAQIAHGHAYNIVQIAMGQRRDDLSLATPLAEVSSVGLSQRKSKRL